MSEYSGYFVVRGKDVGKSARDYLSGLLGTERRKNMERIHGDIPQSNYQGIQQFISDSPWDQGALMNQVAQDANGILGGHPRSCLILDETTFIKKGDNSVGVQRQYCGACQDQLPPSGEDTLPQQVLRGVGRKGQNLIRGTHGEPLPARSAVECRPERIGGSIGHRRRGRGVRQEFLGEYRILEAALVRGRGQLNLDKLKKTFADNPSLVGVGSEFSTREILTQELFLIRTVNAGRDALSPIADRYEPAERLGPDQRNALVHVLTSCDRVTGFRGLAGTGKSTTLVELAKILQNEGRHSVFCAPTASAVDTLRSDLKPLGQEPMTIAKLLANPEARQSLSNRSVLVVDEAAAVGLDDLRRLFELVILKKARIVLVGDTGQHASVARGDALRIIEQYSDYRFAELMTIRRQKPEAFRQAVELAAHQQTDKAFAKLVELGAVTEGTTDGGQLYNQAADAYLLATNRGKSALLVSPTWAEIELVTERVRETLKAKGALGRNEETISVFDSLYWTEAHRRNSAQFQPGQRIHFLRAAGSFAKGDTLQVIGVDAASPGTLRLRLPDGTEKSFNPGRHAAAFDVGEVRELKVAPGDWLLLQANYGKELVNGERVQVREIQNGRIALADGRQLPAGYNTFTHGYAVTSHSSQSKTVDEVLCPFGKRALPVGRVIFPQEGAYRRGLRVERASRRVRGRGGSSWASNSPGPPGPLPSS